MVHQSWTEMRSIILWYFVDLLAGAGFQKVHAVSFIAERFLAVFGIRLGMITNNEISESHQVCSARRSCRACRQSVFFLEADVVTLNCCFTASAKFSGELF